ncbi:MAG: SusC/RagA family TonB-linked outer membrane protein [Bacteroidota bacterium]
MKNNRLNCLPSWMSPTRLLSLLAAMMLSLGLHAQSGTVSGTVTASDTEDPLVGVTVTVKGSTTGALTDDAGKYSIPAPSDGTLVFSYLGYETQEVKIDGRSTVAITLISGDLATDEVVITAFGIAREKKALGYSVTEVDGSNFVEAREVNVGNSLAGRVAGVNVASPATGKAGSTRITIRGNSSISGNNQPLFVVDGVPIDNTNLGSAGMWGGSDQGDGISSLNPDDIETMSVLKGATAAALYGSRAGNGVILITTKGGVNRKGIGVEINSNFMADQVLDFTDFQREYGSGDRGVAPASQEIALENGLNSWGAPLDGSSVVQFDGVARPYSYVPNNISNFYRTGTTFTNTLALTGGSEKYNFRFSASNLDNEDVVPNAGLTRNTFTANIQARPMDRLIARVTASYSRQNVQNRPRLSDSPGNANYTVNSLPPNINVLDLQGDPNKLGAQPDGNELQFNDNIFVTNPYWAAHQFYQNDFRERLLGSFLLRYEFTDWLYLQGRVGMDGFNRKTQGWTPYGTAFSPLGSINEGISRFVETNADFLLGSNQTFDNGFGYDVFVGGNQMYRKNESVGVSGSPLEVPFVHSLANVSIRNGSFGFNELAINSLFYSAEINYGGYLYLTTTGRQDWFSVLNAPEGASIPFDNSEFYPSFALSFVLSDAVELPTAISFAKVRASWAQVANTGAVGPYALTLPYALVGGHLGRPLGRINGGTIPPLSPSPPTVTEFEVGADIRLFNNRFGIDFAYYNKVSQGDLLPASISEASGYSNAILRVGQMTNRGVELLITGTPVKTNDFRWDVTFNFAQNNNTVDDLGEGVEDIRVSESRTRNAYIHHVVGLPYSQIMGFSQAVDDAGNLVYDGDGLPVRGEFGPLGTGVHPNTFGLINEFTYKGFRLSFLLDMKTGGFIYNATNAYNTSRGLHKQTLEGRNGDFAISGVTQTGTDPDNNPIYESISTNVTAQDYYQRIAFNITDQFVESADFAKLRQISFGYSLPNSIMEKTPFSGISVSLVGRNLALLWSKAENIDPESTYTNGNAQGLEMFGVPASRSYGVNLNLKF